MRPAAITAPAPPPIDGATPSLLRHVLRVLVALGVLSVAISLAGRHYGGQIRLGGNTVSTELREVVIADAVFSVPENLIRHRDQRVDGVAARLDLYVLWPSMSGYTLADRQAFETGDDADRKLIFISIEPQQMSRDMTGRLEPIYRQLVEPLPAVSPFDGLDAYRFRADHAIFSNEVLYVGRSDTPFVARCIEGRLSETISAACERDIVTDGGISVKYRFPQDLLTEHLALDQGLRGLIASLQK
ncbi:MAG: hypothetical protein MUC58_02230 [Rhizobiaceae bacterium]|nr:hypothetical protein [Rhizobiaceae bacterium]